MSEDNRTILADDTSGELVLGIEDRDGEISGEGAASSGEVSRFGDVRGWRSSEEAYIAFSDEETSSDLRLSGALDLQRIEGELALIVRSETETTETLGIFEIERLER